MQRYRSAYTGKEIDELLSSIKLKIDETYITNDYSGGTNRVASAELAKDLDTRVKKFQDPNFFKDLLSQVPDNNLFTDDYKAKLESLSDKFKGVFNNKADRDAAINTVNFLGGEITLLLDDGSDSKLQEWSVWNNQRSRWEKSLFYKSGELDPITITVPGTVVFASFDRTLYNTCKMLITGVNGSASQCCEALLVHNNNDTFLSVISTVGSTNQMFKLSTALVGDMVRLLAQTTATGAQIRIKKIVEM